MLVSVSVPLSGLLFLNYLLMLLWMTSYSFRPLIGVIISKLGKKNLYLSDELIVSVPLSGLLFLNRSNGDRRKEFVKGSVPLSGLLFLNL